MKKLALLFILFSSTLFVYSQCDVNNKYDKIISGYHSSIALKDNGIYSIWGSSMSEMGTDVLSPQDINATSYSDLLGRTVYKTALGGNRSGASVDQAIFLTDYVGLWFWGVSGAVVKSTYLSPIDIPGANAYGLPQGVVPESVKSLFATYQTLVISTDSGFVYMLTQTSLALEGNGGNASTAGTSTWQKVKINASTYLTDVVSVRGQVSSSSNSAFMAVTSAGAVYTWGNTTYLGDNSASAARNYATQMTLPAEFASSVPAMIGVTGGIGNATTTKNTYYILSNAGNLYALGDNSLRQCGDFTTTERTSWVRVQKSATPGDYLNNVNTISVQEHNSSFPAAAVITSTGVLYTWGVNSSGMIGRTDNGTLSGTMNTVSFDPGIPVGFSVANDQALIVEVGGHTLVYTKVGSSQFCYVGHQISGSMGDGTTSGAGTSSTSTMIYNCSSTPAIAICGHVPVAASTTTSTISATPNSIVANGTSTSTVTVTLYNSSGTQLSTSGGIVVINTTAGTISSVTDNGDGTYSAILTSAVTSGSATLSFSINGVVATATTSVTFTGGTTYTIISSAGANGSISPAGSTSVNSGANQLYTFTPSAGYTVDSLFIDGVAQAAANTYSFSNVTTNHTIDVSFKVSTGGTTYTIISSAGANGSISPAGSTSVNSGANQSYTFTPSAGYTVDSLFIDGVAQAAANTYSFTNVTTNHSIDVSFKILSSSTSIPAIAYSGAAAADTIAFCSGTICPLNWGYSNYQWYLNGVALAAPYGTASCLDSVETGSYTLAAQDGFGTWSVQSNPVYVILDTTCTVSSGTGGGVESKSLGDIIAKRVFGNYYNSIAETNGFNSGVKFNNSVAVVNGIADLKLSNLAPTKVLNTDAAYVSTPTDLVNFTNAVEVLAVDYAKSSNTKAVLFSTKTFNNIYSHTKPICDRLRGAELLEVKNVFAKGYSLVAYKIRQRTGELEYAINLSAGTAVSRNTITLQSHWFTDNYQSDEVLYNFQLWAVSYEMVQSMASDIIGKLQANGVVVAVGNTAITKTFISKGGRKSTNIQFTLHNNSTDTIGYFELREKANEPLSSNQIVVKQIPFTAKANSVSNFSIPVTDKYEHNIYVYLNNKLVDLVFFADGTWTLDYNSANTNINSFNVVNEPNVTVKENEYRLFRNVTVSGTTRDYITIYKTMMGGGIEENLSHYKSIIFNTNVTGAGSVKITLVKKSIVNWNDQYSYTVDLSGNNEYGINLKDFKSAKYNYSINADDIVSVSFAFINNRGPVTNMNINLSNVRFRKSEFTNSSLNVMTIKPNPSTGVFYTSFTSDIAQTLVLNVIELSTGRIIKTNFVNAIKGSNEVKVILESSKLNSGTFVVTIEGDNVKFKPAKLLFLNK